MRISTATTTSSTSSTSSTTTVKEKEHRLLYKTVGPTWIHFEHELFLWASLSILSAASLQALYRRSFGTYGDYTYCYLVSLWLARHIILRYLYTTDASTTRKPTLRGVLSHWLTSIVVAGQYFDRPDSHVVARNVGIAHVEDVMNPTSALSLPSFSYTLHFLRVWLLTPILKLTGATHLIRIPLSLLSKLNEVLSHPTIQRIVHYGPSIQLLLAAAVFASCIFYLQSESAPRPLEVFAITMQPAASLKDGTFNGREGGENYAQGAYEALAPPSWQRVFFLMSCGGTMLSVLFYGRISFPIPDLVAGTNVLKALRNEARGTTGKSNKARLQKEQQDSMWSEGYKSVVAENRFRLACKVALLRMMDAIICCSILPRTVYVCRATGHCPSDPTLSELRMIFFPSGITSAAREDGVYESMFYSINPDRGSAILTILSVIVITGVVLLAQLVTLNKSYLAIMGHLAGEWKLVEDQENRGKAAQWDPRRRYKKGDMIVYSYPGFRQSVYMATTNSPEGRPFDLFLRATHDLFQHELGHPVTSKIVAASAKIHCAFMGLAALVLLCYMILDYSYSALITILFANMLACYGVLAIGMVDHDELEGVAKEINGN